MKLVEDFLRYIRYELNLSACTVSAYEQDLKQLQQFLSPDENEFDPLSVTSGDLRAWIVNLDAHGIKARSIRRKEQAVRSFFQFLLKRGLVKSNPAAELELAKFKKPLPSYVRIDNMNALLDGDIDETDFKLVRDRLIIMMLYETGIRRAELIGLKDADVDVPKRELKVLGKRNKERVVPFGDELADAITAYRRLRSATIGLDRTERFFVRENGDELYASLVYRTVHSLLATVGGGRKLSPHVLRHTFASAMLNNGAELNSVKEILGHESLAATQVYTHITFSELKTNYKHAHPRALKKEVHYGSED